ncbi:hypothetical protein FB550_111115 [Neobacillus bataviensis]|uniref:Uncharacterized protein n=1 Tax=Neobacillus bataviensis TaxID=220685 RepID=A0A561D061_9BACI|nr:hypothetical protein [Neobacillus bataviensis]TWD96458.1 hypothetical protein FB550_111115 [Neobacillus bataviensis]
MDALDQFPVLVTPHITEDYGIIDNELNTIIYGICNTGFLGLFNNRFDSVLKSYLPNKTHAVYQIKANYLEEQDTLSNEPWSYDYLMVRKLKASHAKDTEAARSCETSSLILLNIQMQHFLINKTVYEVSFFTPI